MNNGSRMMGIRGVCLAPDRRVALRTVAAGILRFPD